jgi:hypothetical protein
MLGFRAFTGQSFGGIKASPWCVLTGEKKLIFIGFD